MPYRKQSDEPREEYAGVPLSSTKLLDLMNFYRANEILVQVLTLKISVGRCSAEVLDRFHPPINTSINSRSFDWRKNNRLLSYKIRELEENGLIKVQIEEAYAVPGLFSNGYYASFQIKPGLRYNEARIIGVRKRPFLSALERIGLTQPCYDFVY